MKNLKLLKRYLPIYQKILHCSVYLGILLLWFNQNVQDFSCLLHILVGLSLVLYVFYGIRLKQKYIYKREEKIEIKRIIKEKNKEKLFQKLIHIFVVIFTLIILSLYAKEKLKTNVSLDEFLYIHYGIRMLVVCLIVLYSELLMEKTLLIVKYVLQNKCLNDDELVPEREITWFANSFLSYVIDSTKFPFPQNSIENVYFMPRLAMFGLMIYVYLLSLNPGILAYTSDYKENIWGLLGIPLIFIFIFSILSPVILDVPYVCKNYKSIEIYNNRSESWIYLILTVSLSFILFYNVLVFIIGVFVGYPNLANPMFSLYLNEHSLHFLMIEFAILCAILVRSSILGAHIENIMWKDILEKEAKEKGEEHAS